MMRNLAMAKTPIMTLMVMMRINLSMLAWVNIAKMLSATLMLFTIMIL